jgi:hypothetical protein
MRRARYLIGAFVCAACGAGAAEGGGEQTASITDCEGRGEAYVPGMDRPTEDGRIDVALIEASPAPPANADNFWTIELSSEGGGPVEGAEVVAVPFMIDHGHGAPSQVATAVGAGRYELGPLNLFMPGYWEVTLTIVPDGEEESSVVFGFCVPPS